MYITRPRPNYIFFVSGFQNANQTAELKYLFFTYICISINIPLFFLFINWLLLQTFQSITDFLKSGLYKWAGDALTYDSNAPYIELVTSPNNPDGYLNEAVINRAGGKLIHDLTNYWPQYTSITKPADHDLILFTASKCTGHAGTRIGYAFLLPHMIDCGSH